eukprot:799025-Rhodomonas_salina.4
MSPVIRNTTTTVPASLVLRQAHVWYYQVQKTLWGNLILGPTARDVHMWPKVTCIYVFAYARATGCPVLTSCMLLPGRAGRP